MSVPDVNDRPQRLDVYLSQAGRRMRLRFLARSLALIVVVLLGVTTLGAVLVMRLVPDAAVLTTARAALVVGLVLALAYLALRRGRPQATAAELERRVPAFSGRLVTWLDAARHGQRSDLLSLLERQTWAIAGAHPPRRTVALREILVPAALVVLALGLLVGAFVGERPWQLAAQRLLAGDLLSGARPRIAVSPGDAVVRRGSDVVIEARAVGFAPDGLEVSAAFGGGGWERASMAAADGDGYSFVLVGVAETVDYYVAGRGIRSNRHRIEVAELPKVTGVETRYRFPEWTGLADDVRDRGDVAALPGTEVEVTLTTDMPLSEARLVLDGEPRSAAVAAGGTRVTGAFSIAAPGRWHLAVPYDGQLARISDNYLIEVVEDAPPEVEFVWPAHDRKATPIEEVALEFEASDDYGVTDLRLSYAVNGGDWVTVPLPDGRHLLRLESLDAPDEGPPRPLAPGDVISFYAEARDHSRATRSALYFVDVRPFDMRYRESQQMGGQSGAEGGGFDIAERQRDILTATWNLLNQRDAMEPRALDDQTRMLSMLQETLREQVRTVISRSTARGLSRDDEVSGFIAALTRAEEQMGPAAARLSEQALEDAVPHEQQALRHLVTAESSVRDVDVSLSRSDARGTSGRSLGELVELEMDPERNRYEMPQQPGFGSGADPAADEAWQRLDELAARQEQLARRGAQGRETLPSRWEQARLRREIERLREELAQQTASSSQPGAPGGAGRALQELDRARAELDRADSGDPQAAERAAEALRRAAGSMREASRGDVEQRLARSSRQLENLRADQARVMESLEALQRESLQRAREGEGLAANDFAMHTFADTKRRMQQELDELRRDLTDISADLGARSERSAEALDRALQELDDVRVGERLAASADAFELGQPLYVIGSESLVEQALGRLDRRLAETRRALEAQAPAAADPLAQVRDLRRRLDGVANGPGSVNRDAVEAVVRDLERLGTQTPTTRGGAPALSGDPRFDRGRYHIRGTADENTATLLELTRERLDLVENELLRRDSAPVRAQQPREPARDSAAAARYFRELGRTAPRPEG